MDNERISTIEVLTTISIDTLDWNKLKEDSKILDAISESFPKDNHLDKADFEQLLNKSVNAINICDRWIPILHVVFSEIEIKRDRAKNEDFINAEPKVGKLTADVRKAIAESGERYNELKLLTEKIASMKTYFERKGKSATSAFFYFKQQYFGYENKGNRYIVGSEEMKFPDTDVQEDLGQNYGEQREWK